MTRRVLRALPLALAMSALAVRVYAQDESPSNAEIAYAIDNMMLFIAAVLVFFMQAGFALVEAGFNSAKNALNIMFKNFIDVNVGIIIYWLFGYGVMYGAAVIPGWLAWNGWGVDPTPPTPGAGVLNTQVDWLFQVAFAATAATIVSGAVAGRIKFSAYLVYTIFISAIVYPISGYWKWGGGWLNELGFHDFAGSLVVHAVGGFAGLAGAILLGPRIGRFSKGGNTLPPHNYTLATLGVFILWIGWYGFNPGSQLAIVGAANTDITMMIAVNTTLAAAAGAVVALLLSRFLVYSKWDLGLALNGMLAGLVGITANCDAVTNSESMIIGAIAAGLMTGAVVLLERWKIDDPVGAFPVHGVCGVWAGLATAFFGDKPLVPQLIGSTVIPLWSFVLCFGLFYILKQMNALRVSPEEETTGLDLSEHGTSAYGQLAGMAGD